MLKLLVTHMCTLIYLSDPLGQFYNKGVGIQDCFSHEPDPEGYSHVKAYRNVLPKWVTFSPKIPRYGSHFGFKKILRGGSHFTKNCEKIVKSAVFETIKPLEMGLDLLKFQKTV